MSKKVKLKHELEERGYKIEAEIKGVSPLLHNKISKEDLQEKRTKTIYRPKEEAEKRLYSNGNDPFAPAKWIKGCLRKAAVNFKLKGKKTYKDLMSSEVFIQPFEIPLNNKWVIDEQILNLSRVSKSKVIRCRPRFDEWKLNFEILIADKDDISPDIIKLILEHGGKYIGIGDNRPEHGRFLITKFNPVY